MTSYWTGIMKPEGMPLLCLGFILTQLIQRGYSQACASNGYFGENRPRDKDNSIEANEDFGYMMEETTYIIDCCGVVTSWEAFFDNVVGSRTVYFQIWRQLSGDTFTLVGENDFTVTVDGEQSKSITQANRITIKPGDQWGWWTDGTDVIKYKRGGGEEDNNQLLVLTDLNVGDTQNWGGAANTNDRSYAVRLDVDANTTPTFDNLPSTVTEANDITSGTSIFTVSYSDIDTFDVSSLSIVMATNSYFSFDTATGIVRTATTQGAAVVRNVVFEVSDQCSNTATATLTVSITNDPPTINNLPAAISISEDLTTDTLHYTINVTDTVSGSTLTCSLASGGSGKFDVRLISTEYGVYSVDNPSFDYNTLNTYSLSVQCSDGSLTDTETLTVNLIKNSAPVIVNLQNSTSLSTTTAIGTTVFTVITTDAENNDLSYNITCNPSTCPFAIFSSGEIRLTEDISNHTQVGYDVSVTVADSRNTVGPKTLTITIADINDPVQISNLPIGSPLTITENTALATNVYTVSYSDVDTSQAHTFTMTSSPSEGSTYFTIDSNTGVISTSGTVINYESLGSTSFTFSITVNDPITSDTQSLTIDVINQNEVPSFSQSSYTLSTTEGTAGAVVGTPNLGLTDPDSGDTTTLTMDCGSSSGYFYIDGSTGTITFQSEYDLDSGSLPTTVSCTLTATDSGGLTATAALTITIAYINDNVPIFSPASYSFYISYYATVGVTVGTVSASDGDSGSDGTMTFTLNQTHLSAEYFSIDNAGVIAVTIAPSAGSAINYSMTVSVTAIATDFGGLSDTATVVIVISDTTTTSTTTTTDRYRTFFEDTKNIVWFLACIATLTFIAGYLLWLMYTCKGENSCDNWLRRFRQRRKLKKQLQNKRKRKERRRRRSSTPDIFTTLNELSMSPTNSNNSIRNPPPPISHQAWRSSVI